MILTSICIFLFNVPLFHTIQQLQRSCLELMDIQVEK